MVVVLNPLFSSCCKLGTRGAGKFERACGLKALASDKLIGWVQPQKMAYYLFSRSCCIELRCFRRAFSWAVAESHVGSRALEVEKQFRAVL